MKRSPLRKLSKHPAAEYSRQATKWWRECVRLIWKNRCALRGVPGHVCAHYNGRPILEAHHIIPKSVSEFHRHNPTNGIYLCPKAHDWAENERKAFLETLKAVWPSMYAAYEENSANRRGGPFSSVYYREKTEELKALAKRLSDKG